MRRILVQRRMSVNAVTRGFTAAPYDRLFPLAFPSNAVITKRIRRVVLAWWAHSASACLVRGVWIERIRACCRSAP
jgi:hypothetical protein